MRSGSLFLSKALLQLSVRWNLLNLLLLLLCLIACTRSLLVASTLSTSRLLFFLHGLLLLFALITLRCRRLSKGVAISVLRQHVILVAFDLKLLFLLGLFLASFSSLGLYSLLTLQADSIDTVSLNEVSVTARQELLLFLFLLLPNVVRGIDHDLLRRRLVLVPLSHSMLI